MKPSSKIFLVIFLISGMAACSQAGWIGYYQTYPDTTTNKYVADSGVDTVATSIILKNKQELWLELPKNNSYFKLAGIITPFTPPIPIFFFRNWDDSDFTIQSKPPASIKLKLENPKTHEVKLYEPKTSEALYGYTRYTFPIKSKNLDSGILIIEKEGEVIEVPFEYKYQKFWH